MTAFHLESEQSRPFGHILHCVDALRQDVICNADDTPRYSTETPDPKTGEGQYRQCRDWSKLEAWGRQHNACFSYVHEADPTFPNVERFAFCPEDSPYKVLADHYFQTQGFSDHPKVGQPGSASKRDKNAAPFDTADVIQPGSVLKRDKAAAPLVTPNPSEELRRDETAAAFETAEVTPPGSVLKRGETVAAFDPADVTPPGSVLKRDEPAAPSYTSIVGAVLRRVETAASSNTGRV